MRETVVGGLDSTVKLANLGSVVRKVRQDQNDRKEDPERVLRQD